MTSGLDSGVAEPLTGNAIDLPQPVFELLDGDLARRAEEEVQRVSSFVDHFESQHVGKASIVEGLAVQAK
jgi:hypothetical protein